MTIATLAKIKKRTLSPFIDDSPFLILLLNNQTKTVTTSILPSRSNQFSLSTQLVVHLLLLFSARLVLLLYLSASQRGYRAAEFDIVYLV